MQYSTPLSAAGMIDQQTVSRVLVICLCVTVAWSCDSGEVDTPPSMGTEMAGPMGTTTSTNPGSAEACDGLDNDADGSIDEGVLRSSCSNECGTGIQECRNGMWVDCSAPLPSMETCDALDNDCDGRIDESLARPCESSCGQGEETCSQGRWVACTAPPANEPEVCDGQDNDCDGTIDENVFRACTSDCSAGTEQCVNGNWGACDAQTPAVEECSDGIDNDCDGQVDEGDACTCSDGDQEECSTDLGECEAGNRTCECTGSEENRACSWSRCRNNDGIPVTLPGDNVEECNAKDDDCNGIIDDILPSSCGSSNVGECTLGQFSCVSGELFCVGEVEIQAEICDGLDNDCDELNDEGLSLDIHESNDQCEDAKAPAMAAEADASIPQDTERPLVISGGALYTPDGTPDRDWFHVMVREARTFGLTDPDYRIRVEVSDYPPNVDFRLCVTFSEQELLSNACDDSESIEVCAEPVAPTPLPMEPSPPETSGDDEENGDAQSETPDEPAPAENQPPGGSPTPLVVDYVVDTSFGIVGFGSNDDIHALIHVFADAPNNLSCEPYTLTIATETVR